MTTRKGRTADPARKRAISSRDLGIDLRSGEEQELFKWFLACLLFGKPIQQEVAGRAYQELVAVGLVTPQAILEAGWDRLVAVLDRGHYVRFDFSTATRLLEVARALLDRYGTLSGLLDQARTRSDLSQRLQAFKGVGPTTACIFLRDILREVPAWRGQTRSTPTGARRQRRARVRVGRQP